MLTITQPSAKWFKAHAGDLEIGGFGETTRTEPELRWYWEGAGSFGYTATRDEAVAALAKMVPVAQGYAATERAEAAEFAALPEHLQELKAAMDQAEIDQRRAWGASTFNDADYRSASQRWFAARLAFDKAHDAWASQREAA